MKADSAPINRTQFVSLAGPFYLTKEFNWKAYLSRIGIGTDLMLYHSEHFIFVQHSTRLTAPCQEGKRTKYSSPSSFGVQPVRFRFISLGFFYNATPFFCQKADVDNHCLLLSRAGPVHAFVPFCVGVPYVCMRLFYRQISPYSALYSTPICAMYRVNLAFLQIP